MAVLLRIWTVLLLFSLNTHKLVSGNAIDFEIEEMRSIDYLVANLPSAAHLADKYPLFHRQLQFSLQPSIGSSYLRVDSQSGILYVRNRIDRESLCPNFPSTCCPNTPQSVCYIPLTISVVLPTENGAQDLKEMLELRIIIKDINDSPCQFQPQASQIVYFRENDPVGTSETLNTPRDPDTEFGIQRSQIQFVQQTTMFDLTIRELSSLDPKFRLELVLKDALDREMQDSYEITVRADDGNVTHRCFLQIKVIVLDVNDQTPRFENSTYLLLVAEDHPIDRPIIVLHAVDNDLEENGRLSYDIDSSLTTTQVLDAFSVNRNTGEVLLVRRLDAAKMLRYSVPIIAKDSARRSLTGSTLLVVHVVDVNDNSPIVNILDVSGAGAYPFLFEEQPAGVDVATIRVTDADVGINAQVTCLMDENDERLFAMTKFAGQRDMYKITSRVRLDREKLMRDNVEVLVRFQLKCFDGGTPSRSVTSTGEVLIRDVNDNAPKFHNKLTNISILEDSAPQRLLQEFRVIQMNASDPDYGINAALTWSVQEFDQEGHLRPSDIFFIDGVGLIRSHGQSDRGQLDRERQSFHNILVTASDGGKPLLSASITVAVYLLDFNDNAPTFGHNLYDVFNVTENSPVGYEVGSLFAIDADIDHNARLFYSISSASDGRYVPFRVTTEEMTDHDGKLRYLARIFTDGEIDREALMLDKNFDDLSVPAYTFRLLVHDNPPDVKDRQFGETQIQIKVLDVNDRTPIWKYPQANSSMRLLSYLEPEKFVVATVLAQDLDSSENGLVSYRIMSGNERGVFLLHSRNGSLQVARLLDKEDMGLYTLTLEAVDNGRIPLRSATRFQIMVDASMPTRSQGSYGSGTNPVNLYIIIAIIVSSFVIAVGLLFAICVVLRKSQYRMRSNVSSVICKEGPEVQSSYSASPTILYNSSDCSGTVAAYPTFQNGGYPNSFQRREVTFTSNQGASVEVTPNGQNSTHFYSQKRHNWEREKNVVERQNGTAICLSSQSQSQLPASQVCFTSAASSIDSHAYANVPLSKLRAFGSTDSNAQIDSSTGGYGYDSKTTYTSLNFDPKSVYSLDIHEQQLQQLQPKRGGRIFNGSGSATLSHPRGGGGDVAGSKNVCVFNVVNKTNTLDRYRGNGLLDNKNLGHSFV